MDEKITILLDKINIKKEEYIYFENTKLEKIKINSTKNDWHIYIKTKELLPISIYQELEENKHLLDENASITFFFEVETKKLENY